MRDTSGDHSRQPDDDGGTPRFGRLLLVLALAVFIIMLVTLGSEAYFS